MNHDDDKVNSDDKHTLHQTLITVRIMMMIRMRMTVIYLVAGLATLRMLHTCC